MNGMMKASWVGLAFLGAGCMAEPIPATPSVTPESYAGTYRIATIEAAGRFSDYVFGKDGRITHLRSVDEGVVVDAMQGAGVVHGSGAGEPSCAFGDRWRTSELGTLVVASVCTDGMARDLELRYTEGATHDEASVSIVSVAGSRDWMVPETWRFQRCDLHVCKQ